MTMRLLLAVALLAMAVSSGVAASSDLTGEWEGQFQSNGRPIQVIMSVAAPNDSGKVAPKIHYGSPRNCRIDFEAGRVDPSKPIFFGILKVNGGYCLKFLDGYMRIQFSAPTSIDVTVSSKSGGLQETVTLERMAK